MSKAGVDISCKKLERYLQIAARVVALYGENYLPIFNRVHIESIRVKETEDQNSLALQLALSYNKDT